MTDDTQPWRLDERQAVELLKALKADADQPGTDEPEEVDEMS